MVNLAYLSRSKLVCLKPLDRREHLDLKGNLLVWGKNAKVESRTPTLLIICIVFGDQGLDFAVVISDIVDCDNY
jgi:hypothetical protein